MDPVDDTLNWIKSDKCLSSLFCLTKSRTLLFSMNYYRYNVHALDISFESTSLQFDIPLIIFTVQEVL